jgi:hypothetical protein
MNDEKRIKVDDIVTVSFNGSQTTLCHFAKVLYLPCAPGDSWVFEDVETHDIHYVSEGCTITKFFPNDSIHLNRKW